MTNIFIYVLLFSCVVTLYAGRVLIDFPKIKCISSRGETCVAVRQCPFFDELLNRTSKPRPRSVINMIRENQCGFDGNTPYVCCVIPTPPPETTTEVSTTSTSTTATPLIRDLRKILTRHKNVDLLPNDNCGPISTNSRITSGTKTEASEFPWMALIAYFQNDKLDFRCGGTVINERYVLTAAHCIEHSTIVGVRLGEHNLDTLIDCDQDEANCVPPPQDFYIENITVHPEYNAKTFTNDIALIKLATPANFSFSNVKPICLPMGSMDLTGRQAIVAGWGVTENGYKSKVLLKVSLPVVPISICQEIYRNRFAPITGKQICAGGYNGKDSCAGDSGGPMQYAGVVNGTPRFIQYGIVSYGPRYCGANGYPSVYTKVPMYMKWILDNLDPPSDD